MPNRRLPKRRMPKRRFVALSVAGLLVVGGAALAEAAVSGDSGTQQVASGTATGEATTATPTDGSTSSASATPSATAQTTSTPTASATPTPTATSTANRGVASIPHWASPPLGGSTVFTGKAFDTCTAPSLAAMNAWHASSPYGAAAVYIGGQNRGCAQPNLTSSWVSSVNASGWRLIPIYVGAQPPCQTSGNPEKIGASNAASLGAADGADAVAKASALGMRTGSGIYLDMEAYDISNTSCVQAVLTYIQAYDRAVHSKGYWAGFYGFSSSSAKAVADAASRGVADLPDALWYARYDNNADTTTGYPFSPNSWTNHRRGHQYAVNLTETYGGVTLTVDHDAWDAPVAVVG